MDQVRENTFFEKLNKLLYNEKRRGRITMQKRRGSSKLGIILAVVSAIPAILSVVRAVKESKESKER